MLMTITMIKFKRGLYHHGSPTRSHLPINVFYSYISPLSHLRHNIHREGTMKDLCEYIRIIIWVDFGKNVETVRVWEGYIADIVG